MPVRAMLRRGSSCQVGFVELRCPLCPSDISPASGGKPGILQTFYQCKHARDFRLQQLVLEIHGILLPFLDHIWFDAVFVDGDAESGAIG